MNLNSSNENDSKLEKLNILSVLILFLVNLNKKLKLKENICQRDFFLV